MGSISGKATLYNTIHCIGGALDRGARLGYEVAYCVQHIYTRAWLLEIGTVGFGVAARSRDPPEYIRLYSTNDSQQ